MLLLSDAYISGRLLLRFVSCLAREASRVVPTMPISRNGNLVWGRDSEVDRWWWEAMERFWLVWQWVLEAERGAVDGGVSRIKDELEGATTARPEWRPRRERNV